MNLPFGWSVLTLEEVCSGSLQTGPFGSQLHADEYTDEGVPVVMPKDLVAGRIVVATTARIPEIRAEQLKRHRIQVGDVLFSRRGDVARAGLATKSDEGFLCGTGCLCARPDRNKAHPEFLNLLIQSPTAKRWLENNAVGQTMPNMNTEILSQLTFRVPPLSEQQQISELVSSWDTAIEKTELLIAAKRQCNEALSIRLLFGHVRFGQRNTKTTRTLHWFSAPSDWQIVEIGKVAREVSALNGKDGDLPVLSCTKYDGLVDSLKYFDKQVFSHDTSKYKVVRHGQFAYATNHIEEGSIGYQDLVPAGLVSPIYTVFQADAEQIDDSYFYKLLKTEKMRQIFAAQTNASVDRRGSLRWKEFARIHIPLPPLDEQREISAVLDEAKREVALLQTQLAALKTQKRGLMQKLLTGQWRLNIPTSKEVSNG